MGIWNGWGYGSAFFRALNFQISEPTFGDFFGLGVLGWSLCGVADRERPLLQHFHFLLQNPRSPEEFLKGF